MRLFYLAKKVKISMLCKKPTIWYVFAEYQKNIRKFWIYVQQMILSALILASFKAIDNRFKGISINYVNDIFYVFPG